MKVGVGILDSRDQGRQAKLAPLCQHLVGKALDNYSKSKLKALNPGIEESLRSHKMKGISGDRQFRIDGNTGENLCPDNQLVN